MKFPACPSCGAPVSLNRDMLFALAGWIEVSPGIWINPAQCPAGSWMWPKGSK